MLRHILVLLLLAVSASAQGAAPPAESAPARVERFLAAMGGREAWRNVRAVVVRATHYEADLRLPYANAIWNDFTAPRVRIEAKSAELDVRRGMDGDKGWRARHGQVAPLTAAQLRDDQRWWEANLYRTLHRLAAGDPDLTARAVGDRRLEIFRTDGVRLNWFELNPAGEPIRFGTWESEDGTVFGPVAAAGAVRHPRWGANATGTWRYEVGEFIPLSAPPADVSFSAP